MASERDDLASSYAGVFDGHLTFGQRPALLIVDFVMAYLDPASPLYANAAAALASNERIVTAARSAGLPVVFTNVRYAPGGGDGGLFYRKVPALEVLQEGNPLGDFPPSLSPQPSDLVVTKKYASAFFGTDLAATLIGRGIDTVLITGVSTSGCVRATALDAMQNGFAPFVVRDGCADRHPGPHEASLFDLQAKYAEVIDEAQATVLMAEHAAR